MFPAGGRLPKLKQNQVETKELDSCLAQVSGPSVNLVRFAHFGLQYFVWLFRRTLGYYGHL
jgi:hypothetical protein